MNTDWIDIPISVPNSYFVKKTDASLCFLLWQKKRLAFPLRWMKNCSPLECDPITFTFPRWFIEKHKLRSLVEDEELKDFYFPLKRDLKKKEKEKGGMPLFSQMQASKKIEDVGKEKFEKEAYGTWSGTRQGGKTEAQKPAFTVLRDEDIPF